MSILTEINEALSSLALGAEDALVASEDVAAAVIAKSKTAFVSEGAYNWWWEAFREPTASLQVPDGCGWRVLAELVRDANERVWFIAEPEPEQASVVFDSTPEVISRNIGECYAFEYYLVAKDFAWLICENHHNVLIVVGESVMPRLIHFAGMLDLPVYI